MLDSHDVAKILKVQARTIVNWAKENLGPKCKKIGKSYIYTKRDIAEFLATS
ncbi:helix-turn-helix domain-containing protein [Aliarcobacter cryaerophilus]|uniref:helix-turn-helix domain-containing protein n=1 Tax=Aliarcobacter cryaerophilus TaxID=28198 RepID=UPI003DA4CFB1